MTTQRCAALLPHFVRVRVGKDSPPTGAGTFRPIIFIRYSVTKSLSSPDASQAVGLLHSHPHFVQVRVPGLGHNSSASINLRYEGRYPASPTSIFRYLKILYTGSGFRVPHAATKSKVLKLSLQDLRFCARARTRTWDHGGISSALYQLSYTRHKTSITSLY